MYINLFCTFLGFLVIFNFKNHAPVLSLLIANTKVLRSAILKS